MPLPLLILNDERSILPLPLIRFPDGRFQLVFRSRLATRWNSEIAEEEEEEEEEESD